MAFFKRPPQKELVVGRKPVIEAIRSDLFVDKILVDKNWKDDDFHELLREVKKQHITLQKVPGPALDKYTPARHQGVIAFLSPIPFYDIRDVLPLIYEQGETPLLLLLDSIKDVRNFGAIARTAWAMGVHALLIPSKGNARVNEVAMKASAGALAHLSVCKSADLLHDLKFLKLNGIQVFAASGGKGTDVAKANLKTPTAIVLGSESSGVDERIAQQADEIISLPMQRDFESLNVSVAAGMLLYETYRQRLNQS